MPIGGMQGDVQVFWLTDVYQYLTSVGAMSSCFNHPLNYVTPVVGSLIAVDFGSGGITSVGADLTLLDAPACNGCAAGWICFSVVTAAPASKPIVLLSRAVSSRPLAAMLGRLFFTTVVTYNRCSDGACSGWQSTPPFSGVLGDAVVL